MGHRARAHRSRIHKATTVSALPSLSPTHRVGEVRPIPSTESAADLSSTNYSETSGDDSQSSFDAPFRPNAELCRHATLGSYRIKLLDWHRYTEEHLIHLLTRGKRHEIHIVALLYPYMFPSVSELLTQVLDLWPRFDFGHSASFAAAFLEYHWGILQQQEAQLVKSMICRVKEAQYPESVTLKQMFRLETAQSKIEANEKLAQERAWAARPLQSASGLLDYMELTTCFEEINPKDAALVLSYLDWKQFNAIPLTEFMRKKFTDRSSAPQIHATIDRFNQATKWIMTMIISPPDKAQRAFFLKRWIQIAQHLLEMHNFSTLQMVITALDHINVSRLKATWETIPADLLAQFREMCHLVTPLQNYRNYRAAFDAAPEGAIPILPTFTKDLFTIEEVHDTFIHHRHLDMRKLNRLYDLITRILACQNALQRTFSSLKVESVQRRFFEKMEGLVDSNDELYDLSVQREPGLQSGSSGSLPEVAPVASPPPAQRKGIFGKNRSVRSTIQIEAPPSSPGEGVLLKIRVVGSTPAFIELGLSSVTKAVIIPSKHTDTRMVVNMLVEKLFSTMRDVQIQLLRKELADYVLYQENERGKCQALLINDKPWTAKDKSQFIFERDHAKAKLSPLEFTVLKLEYQNAILQEELSLAQQEIKSLQARLQ